MTPTAVILIVAIALTTLWVWSDANVREWSGTGWSPGTWVALCIVLWIVFFPYYLVERRKVPTVGTPEAAKRLEQSPPPGRTALPPPGWYVDPDGRGTRWWDGARWTDHLQAR